jgi:S-adenosylmethionine decarboxylase
MKAQMHNYSTWISEVNSDILKTYLKDKLVESGFGIEGFIEKYFYPYGYTCLFLLSESHLAVHTFPEEEKTYIELSSCVKIPFDKFIMSL